MIQLPITSWKTPPDNHGVSELLKSRLGLSPIISNIMNARKIQDLDQAERFLSPSLKDLHNPFLMKDMSRGVARVISAIHRGEKILIYGDYDADGITSVVILYEFLKTVSVDVSYFIPDRLLDGYGLQGYIIEKARSQGISLIIAVDCGSSDNEEILFAKSLGIDAIVLDHHEISTPIPEAVAVINPKHPDCPFPFKHLAAVGIVFNFLIALRGDLRREGFWNGRPYPNLKNYLDIVALGTIADVAPLVQDNRIFVKIGLELISGENRIGLKALKEIASLEGQAIDSVRASFGLIPRINAAGRIASASESVELLLSRDLDDARSIALRLDGYNKKRQAIEKTILDEIVTEVESIISRGELSSLVFASPKWHPGVIGIVASRLVDRYHRPAILISIKDGLGRGSGRSLADFNIYEGLKKCDSYLLSYGGHQYAAGISIREDNIKDFSLLLQQIIEEDMTSSDYTAQTIIDSPCLLSEIDHDLLKQIDLLAPFGSSNPEPVLCARAVSISSMTVVGRNHLKMRISGGGISRSSIWYGKGDFSKIIDNGIYDIAFTPQINRYNGVSEVQLKVRDISLS